MFTDITDPDLYVTGIPHEAFKRLRDEDPVSWCEEKDGVGFWAVTRYADILAVSKNTQVFSSAKGIRLEDMDEEEAESRRTMMEIDPPEHTNYRRMVNPPFSHHQVQCYADSIRQLAREVIATVRGQREFDFVEAIARELPMRMLGKMLGVADSDAAWLVRNGDALLGNADPEYTNFPVDLVDTSAYRLLPFRSPVSLELFAYAAKQAGLRSSTAGGRPPFAQNETGGDDVISMLLKPKRDGEALSELEFKK